MYLDVYEMTNQKLEQKERMKDKISFTCKECGPGIPVYVEIWEQNSDSPIGMYFLDQNIGYAEIVDELILKEVEEPKNINHIQIQPHDFDNESLNNLLELHRNLHKTHKLKLSYPFVWDFWERK